MLTQYLKLDTLHVIDPSVLSVKILNQIQYLPQLIYYQKYFQTYKKNAKPFLKHLIFTYRRIRDFPKLGCFGTNVGTENDED